MRDLEIRGAGNILGVHQHGFIAAVGFEMYCRLLEETVNELRGETPTPTSAKEVTLDIPIDAFIPADYVEDGTARISVYQKLSGANTVSDIDEVERELVDRFGPMPKSVIALLLMMRTKVCARTLGCVKVSIAADGGLTLTLEGEDALVRETIGRIVSTSKRQFDIITGPPVTLHTRLTAASVEDMVLETKDLLSLKA
jgi:transcription-repair coupling factor (superfamily II helicase)